MPWPSAIMPDPVLARTMIMASRASSAAIPIMSRQFVARNPAKERLEAGQGDRGGGELERPGSQGRRARRPGCCPRPPVRSAGTGRRSGRSRPGDGASRLPGPSPGRVRQTPRRHRRLGALASASSKASRAVNVTAEAAAGSRTPSRCWPMTRSRLKVPPISASATMASMRAGSASTALVLAPCWAKPGSEAPKSRDARARATRAVVSRETTTSMSASGDRAMPRVKDGTRAAAASVAPRATAGAKCERAERFSVCGVVLRDRRTSSRHGDSSGGPVRPDSRASSHAMAPASAGAAASIRAMCRIWASRDRMMITARPSGPGGASRRQ